MYQTLGRLDSGRESKLTGRSTSNTADDFDELAIFREFHNPAVAISIRNEDVTISSDCNVVWTIEQCLGSVVAGDAFLSECHQQLPRHVEFVNDVISTVGCPNKTKAID